METSAIDITAQAYANAWESETAEAPTEEPAEEQNEHTVELDEQQDGFMIKLDLEALKVAVRETMKEEMATMQNEIDEIKQGVDSQTNAINSEMTTVQNTILEQVTAVQNQIGDIVDNRSDFDKNNVKDAIKEERDEALQAKESALNALVLLDADTTNTDFDRPVTDICEFKWGQGWRIKQEDEVVIDFKKERTINGVGFWIADYLLHMESVQFYVPSDEADDEWKIIETYAGDSLIQANTFSDQPAATQLDLADEMDLEDEQEDDLDQVDDQCYLTKFVLPSQTVSKMKIRVRMMYMYGNVKNYGRSSYAEIAKLSFYE